MSGRCLEGSGRCLEGSGRCLEGVWKVSGGWLDDIRVLELPGKNRLGKGKLDKDTTGQIRKGNQEILPVLVQMVHIYCSSSL